MATAKDSSLLGEGLLNAPPTLQIITTLNIVSTLASSMGSGCTRHLKVLLPAAISVLGDSKVCMCVSFKGGRVLVCACVHFMHLCLYLHCLCVCVAPGASSSCVVSQCVAHRSRRGPHGGTGGPHDFPSHREPKPSCRGKWDSHPHEIGNVIVKYPLSIASWLAGGETAISGQAAFRVLHNCAPVVCLSRGPQRGCA